MSDGTNDESLRRQFTDFARNFKPVGQKRYAKLIPFKDGIAELRQKGASYRLIREALDALGVKVALDTLGRFCRDVVEQRPARTVRPKRRVRSSSDSADNGQRSANEPETATKAPRRVSMNHTVATPATVRNPDRTRDDGPRIADINTL